MRRREFITLIGGAAVALPCAARSQRSERMHRIGALKTLAADDAVAQARNWRFFMGWNDPAGPLAATYGSSPAGPQAIRSHTRLKP